MFYENWKFLEEFLLRNAMRIVQEEERSNWQLVGITNRGINVFEIFSVTSYIFTILLSCFNLLNFY